MRLFLRKFAIFVKGFTRQDDDIGETTREIGYESSPHYGLVMPVNRSPKGLFRTPRRRGCSRWIPLNRDFDPALGISLLSLSDNSREALVARARRLVKDPGYPPPFVVNAVADLIARHVRI